MRRCPIVIAGAAAAMLAPAGSARGQDPILFLFT
jgi:hypothetical protein